MPMFGFRDALKDAVGNAASMLDALDEQTGDVIEDALSKKSESNQSKHHLALAQTL